MEKKKSPSVPVLLEGNVCGPYAYPEESLHFLFSHLTVTFRSLIPEMFSGVEAVYCLQL